METHNWKYDRHFPNGHDGRIYCMQGFCCRNCDKAVLWPDNETKPPIDGCTGMVAKPKIVRPDPLEGRNDDEVTEKHSKNWQQVEKGKHPKKRR